MRAAAELDRIGALVRRVVLDLPHADDAHLVAVFLAEEGARSGFARVVEAHQPRRHLGVLQHDAIGDVLDRGQFVGRDRLRMGEVEAQPLGRDERALLRDMVAEHEPQRLVQDVGCGMVGARRGPRGVIDGELDRHADARGAFDDRDVVNDEVAEFFARVAHDGAEARPGDLADVADLAAQFAVERRLVEDERAGLTGLEPVDLDAVPDDGADHAFGRLGLVAEEFGGADPLAQAVPHRLGRGFARPGPGAAGLGALARHRGVEAVDVDRQAARAQRILGEVEREAECVVELERRLAGKHAALSQRPRLVLEDREPARERDAEARLLELERLGDQRLGAQELRVGLAHLARQRRDQAPHQRIARPRIWAWRMARRMIRRST